jgi:hypothetical protein
MKKTIAWLFLFALAVVAVPGCHASSVTLTNWSLDGTNPVPDPPPFPV